MLPWDDFQYFLAVAQHRTLSAAAKALGVTQPTVGRRIAQLERQLGAELFVRTAEGFRLTRVAQGMVEHAEAMRDHAARAESRASGHDLGVEGRVRITAAEWVVRSLLGPLLAPLLAEHPRLELELHAEARHLNLSKREADIAIRPSPFRHDAVFQRAVAHLEFGLYAADAYLSRRGSPPFEEGSAGHVLIAMTDDIGPIVDHEWLAPLMARAAVAVRCNGREPMAALAATGAGIACLPCFLGDATPGLRRIATPTPAPVRKLWLGVHRAARRTPRIRTTADFLADGMARLQRALHPSASTMVSKPRSS